MSDIRSIVNSVVLVSAIMVVAFASGRGAVQTSQVKGSVDAVMLERVGSGFQEAAPE